MLNSRECAPAIWLAPCFISILGAVLLWPALYNGYPLAFYDSAAYVDTALRWASYGRPFPYSGFIRLLSLHRSAWPIVVAQAVLVSVGLWLTLGVTLARQDGSPGGAAPPRQEGPPPRWSAGLAAALIIVACSVSALPLYASLLMPDIFAMTGVLGFFLLLYSPSRPVIAFAFALLAFSASFHASHPLVFTLLGCLWAITRKLRRLLLAFTAIGVGVLLVCLMHQATLGRFFFSNTGQTFLFARLVEDDLVRPTLRATCPTEPGPFCAHLEELGGINADDYLWPADSPRRRIASPDVAAEERALILKSVRLFPLKHGLVVLRHLAEGLDKTAGTYRVRQADASNFREQATRAFPLDLKSFDGSRQIRDRWEAWALPNGTRALTPVALALALLALLAAWPGRSSALAGFTGISLSAIVFNALITGSLSTTRATRYFSRLNGLVFVLAALCVVHAAVHLWRRPGGDGPATP